MSTEEEQDEMVFSSVLLKQKEKVEKECIKLQTLIDIKSSNASFMWLPDSNSVNIIDNIFHKTRRIREDEDDDDDDDDEDDNHIDDDDDEDVLGNSTVPRNPKQIFIRKVGSKKTITPEIVFPENGVVLEVEGSASPPTFVPYNYVNRKIKIHKHRKVVRDDNVSDGDIRRSQTPEHVPWGSQSPEIPWS
jgi:hypothetical protein